MFAKEIELGGSMINEEINRDAIALWEVTYPVDEKVWMPSIYPPLKGESILFVGLNPSFSDRGFHTILTDSKHSSIPHKDFYSWKNKSKFNLATAIEIAKESKKGRHGGRILIINY